MKAKEDFIKNRTFHRHLFIDNISDAGKGTVVPEYFRKLVTSKILETK